MVGVLVVDDEAIVRDGLRTIIDLEEDLEVVGEAGDGEEALALAARERPEVALVDIQMPSMDGIELTRRLVAMPQSPRVLILTTFDHNEYVYEAIRAGASGYLLKDVRRAQLTDAIRTVMRDDILLAPSITRRLVEQFSRRPPATTGRPSVLTGLTPREVEVLALVARGRSNTEIATELVVAETSVKTHVARVMTKLGARDRAQLVIAAYETGLVHASDS